MRAVSRLDCVWCAQTATFSGAAGEYAPEPSLAEDMLGHATGVFLPDVETDLVGETSPVKALGSPPDLGVVGPLKPFDTIGMAGAVIQHLPEKLAET